MVGIKEEDWHSSQIQYGRDWMIKSDATAPPPSTADTVTGGIGVKLAPEVHRGGESFTRAMLAHGSAFNGFSKGAFSMNADGELVENENPYLEHYLTFKNVNGKNVTSHKFKNFGSLETQIKNALGTDSSGPYSKLGMQGAALGFGASAGTLASLATGGAISALMGVTQGPKDPLTGEPTAQMIPMLSNAILKHKYDAIAEIKHAIKYGKTRAGVVTKDMGDALTLGGFSFVRKPGDYHFNGNLSAVGLSNEELHGLAAIARGFDPNSYDRENGTGNRILTYGGTAGYMLDGRHVDYRGRIAGAGIGTMRSDTWRAMVNKHFNGNNTIAQQWLAGTEKFRGWSGIKDIEAAQAWFNQMTGSAMGYGGGEGQLASDLGTPTWGGGEKYVELYNYHKSLSGSKFVSPDHAQFLGEGAAGMRWSEFTALDTEDTEDTATQLSLPTNQFAADERQGWPYTLTAEDRDTTYDTMSPKSWISPPPPPYLANYPEEIDFGTPSATDEFSEAYEIGRPYDPTEFSDRYYSGKISGTAYDPNEFSKIYPPVNVTQPPFTPPMNLNPFRGGGSALGSDPYFPSTKSVTSNIVAKILNNNPVGVEATSYSTVQDVKKNNAVVRDATDMFSWKEERDDSLSEQISQAADQAVKNQRVSWKPDMTPPQENDMGNPAFGVYTGSPSGFNRGGRVGYQTGDVVEDPPQVPEVVGGQMPSQVPEQQTIADNMKDTLKEGTFVLNAPAVELAGERDVKDMVMNAFYSAREKGLPIGKADNKLYEKNVDVLLSKGEVTIPPELVKIIGLSKLRKLNNRGLREVERREAEAKQSQAANFPSQMGGMPQFSGGDEVTYSRKVPTDIRKNLENIGNQEPILNQNILKSQLNSSELGMIYPQDALEDVTIVDSDTGPKEGETPNDYWKRMRGETVRGETVTEGEIVGSTVGESVGSVANTVESEGFLTPPSIEAGGDIALQSAMSEQHIKFANAITKAEWGGEHDTSETQAAGYFLRTLEAPKEGSSAYGPLQITGGLLASNFGDIKHLEGMRDSKQSIAKGPSKLMIENYYNGAEGALRDRLSDTEKEFVDALIDQANLFLIYGKESDRKGYDPKFDYGGKGNIQELFPDNYKQLYNSIGMTLIASLSATVDGDPIEFAKLWKAGDDPKKKFTDTRYLEQFTKNLEGFDAYWDKLSKDGKMPIPIANPIQ